MTTIKPTQRDREAAADWCEAQPFPSKRSEAPMIRSGEYDHHSVAQAFARHAVAERAIERAAIVEWLRTDDRFKPYDGAEKSFAFTAALSAAIEAGEHLSDNAEAIARGE